MTSIHRNDCPKRRSFLYSQVPRNRRQSIPYRATWGSNRVIQEAEEGRGENVDKGLYCGFQGEE